jgi:hypothetical protein
VDGEVHVAQGFGTVVGASSCIYTRRRRCERYRIGSGHRSTGLMGGVRARLLPDNLDRANWQ